MSAPFTMTKQEYQAYIAEAYRTTNRSMLWLAACLQQEAGELAQLIIKKEGYNKAYGTCDLVSEAGDVLNFLTIILQYHGLTLEDAMRDNVSKLKGRGWISNKFNAVESTSEDDFNPECD